MTLDLANNVVKFPDIALQLKPELKPRTVQNANDRIANNPKDSDTIGPPNHCPCPSGKGPRHNSGHIGNLSCIRKEDTTTGVHHPDTNRPHESHVQLTNLTSHTITLNPNTTVASFRIMTPNQAKNLQPMSNEQLTLITKYPDEANNVLNQLFQEPGTETNRRWYRTPETCDDPSKLNRTERRIYDEITKLREEEKLDPTADDQQRKKFLAKFQWENSILDERERQQIENLLVKYNNVFARHRLDIGINTDFKIKLTLKHDEPVYAQSLPTPTNLKDDLLVELALMQEYGIITTLPYSKYSSPIFAQRKPNGKLRILVDLRRINHLLKNDYNQHNHPVTTIADATQHMAGKKYFFKLDCSQAYHCLAMADEQSVQLLAFNFGCRTFAYLRLAQGLNRSLSAFNSTV